MEYIDVLGVKVPVLGFGTWDLRGVQCRRAVLSALQTGYRSIDTAEFYDNEEEIGQAIRESAIDRGEIFLTTKVWHNHLSYRDCIESLEASLSKLGTSYVDLFLIHWPNESVPLQDTLEAMNVLVEQGKTRFIGVSNFSPGLLEEARILSPQPILTDQVEYHPWLDQKKLLTFCQKNQVILTAYCPLARGRVMHNPLIQEIAQRYGKTPAQVALRWLIQQHMVIAIPKAATRRHQETNLDIFDFQLTGEEMEAVGRMSR